MRMTVASVSAGIRRIPSSRGANSPGPRTWIKRGPRFTVSVQTALSTVGIAGLSRKTKNTPIPTAIATPRYRSALRRILLFRRSGREISIANGRSTFHTTGNERAFLQNSTILKEAVVGTRSETGGSVRKWTTPRKTLLDLVRIWNLTSPFSDLQDRQFGRHHTPPT